MEKIAFFLPSLVDGGAERTILKLAIGIQARGYPVELVLARAFGPNLKQVPPNLPLVDLNVSRDLMSLQPLVSYLRRERPVSLMTGLHTNLIAIVAGKIAGTKTKIIVSERNTFSTRIGHLSKDARMRMMPLLVRTLYPLAYKIVAVSHGVAEDLVQEVGIAQNRIQVIYNPVITPEFIAHTNVRIDHPWFGKDQPPVILAAGRLTKQKDFPLLINAFASVHQNRPARLMILGEGEERSGLEQMVSQLGLTQDVTMPGFVDNPYPYMRQARVFVLSSRYEGLPGALIEALYCGARLVSTDCPSGPREVLNGGQYGRLVPVGDVDAMVQAIHSALDQEDYCPDEAGWKPFELDNIVNQYLKLFVGKDDL